MFVDFLGVCFDQIFNQGAKLRYMFGGKAQVPMVIRTICGTISPTNPIIPQAETAAPVMSDASTKEIFFTRSTSTPNCAADSSPRLKRLKLCAKRQSISPPTAIRTVAVIANPVGSTSVLPIDHRRNLWVSVALTMEMRNMIMAAKKKLTITPASSSVCVGTRPPILAMLYTRNMVARAPRNAKKGRVDRQISSIKKSDG